MALGYKTDHLTFFGFSIEFRILESDRVKRSYQKTGYD